MQRDCLMDGVPSAVDVNRMVEKVQVLDVPAGLLSEMYPSYFEWTKEERTGMVRVLCLGSPGKGALHELAQTRTVLFRKVYHHQKVRALELMVRRVMSDIRTERNIRSVASLTSYRAKSITQFE
jgi:HD superfamily phosphohydrolase